MPKRIPWSWFERIEPEIAKTYPRYGEKRVRQIAAGLWRKLQPLGYLYDPTLLQKAIAALDPRQAQALFESPTPPRGRRRALVMHTTGGKYTRIADPQPLPKPRDFYGYDSTLVRVVPEIDQLIEVQLRLPPHIWSEIHGLVKDWSDIEIDETDGRIVRRAKLNKATNIFLDKG